MQTNTVLSISYYTAWMPATFWWQVFVLCKITKQACIHRVAFSFQESSIFHRTITLSWISVISHIWAPVACLTKWTQRTFLANSCWPSIWPERLVGTSGTHSHTHTFTHTHAEVDCGVGRNLENALFPREFPWMACLQEQNNCLFPPPFHPSLHPSIYQGKRNLDSWAMNSEDRCFPGTLQ